ncbi:enoyl-CoA hydratase/isomerase family protein [soil metagenome]
MSIIVSVDEKVGIVTFDVPAKKNAFTMEMRGELSHAFDRLGNDDSIRAIILTGAGHDFCSGADVSEMGGSTTADFLDRMRALHLAARAIASVRKPVIAAVDGVCMGAGWSFALACDLIIATPQARFSQIFGRIGYAPDAGAIWLLSRLTSPMRAKEIVYSGRTVGADEALTLGLVLELAARETLMARALEMARGFADGPALANGMSKQLFSSAQGLTFDQFLEQEFNVQPLLATTADHREGLAAFREKRKPVFTGR